MKPLRQPTGAGTSRVRAQAHCRASANLRGRGVLITRCNSQLNGDAAREACGEARQARGAINRRELLLHSFAAPLVLGALTIGSDDPTTLLNSVLAGYGLPKLPNSTGFKVLDDFELEFTLEYPRAWVVRPNSLRQGVYISDYNTADKLSVEVVALPEDGDVVKAAVTAAVVPGQGAGQQDDKLLLPAASKIKTNTATVEGKEYTYIVFPSETITRSGYNIRRKNFAVACVKRGMVYTLNASSRTDQFNKDKEELLRHVVESFRVR